eukprot:GDKK01058835.1.p1 GENE.GDKK01058835.1~~GDKK01058835.1.p1  ORF type:complete len:360 (+),score=60.17 GDKK01058835.1:61-1140(+)
MKKLVISTFFVMQVVFSFAQTATGISGKVVDSKTQRPLQNVVASIQNSVLTALTDGTGAFVFKDVPAGTQTLQIKSTGYKDQLLVVEVTKGKMLDLGVIVFEEDITSEQQLSLVTITENDLGDDNSGSESTSGLLQATRDTYQQAAEYMGTVSQKMQSQTQALTLRGSVQVVCEFFKYAVYSIFFQRGVCDDKQFTTVSKYGVQLKLLENPDVVEYIDKTLSQCADWMEQGRVKKFVVCLSDARTGEQLEHWEFNIETDPTATAKSVSTKSQADIRNEIRLLMMQICASNSFLPPSNNCATFDILTHLDKDADCPDNWVETKDKKIENAQVVKLRDFSTKLHKIDAAVRFKEEDGDLFN